MWSTGLGNGKPLQYSCHENPMNSKKRQTDMTLQDGPAGWQVSNTLLGKSGEIATERIKRAEPKQKGRPAVVVFCAKS